MSNNDAKSTAVQSPSTSRDAESYKSGNECNLAQLTFKVVDNRLKVCSPAHHPTSANSERVMPILSNPIQGSSHPLNEGKSVNKPFGQRAKKSFPQPQRIIRPALGRDPHYPDDIEVVQYVEKGKSIPEPRPGFTALHSIQKVVTTSVEELQLYNLQPTSTVNKASPLIKTEQKDASPVRTPEPTISSHSLHVRNSDQGKISPCYSSSRGSSPTAGPSGAEKMVNDEEMNRTVTSTTLGGGSPIAKEHRKSILASMKQNYTSELNLSNHPSESESSLNDSLGMPTLTANKSLNSSFEITSDKMPNIKADDSFEEELIPLSEKTQSFSYSNLDSQEEDKQDLASTGPINLTCSKTNSILPNSSSKLIPDLQSLHHPPTPALTPIIPPLNPLTDDLEAAMAKLHGESLNDESSDEEIMHSSDMPVTNIIVTRIVEEPSGSCNAEMLSGDASEHESDTDYLPEESDHQELDAEMEEKKSPVKRKMGPKSKMESMSIRKPFTLKTPVKSVEVEGKAASSDEPKPSSAANKSKSQPRVPRLREVEKLCEDEMVQKIFLDLEERGLNKRRSTYSTVTYKEDLSNISDKEPRGSRRGKRTKKEDDSSFECEMTPSKKKKMGRLRLIPQKEEATLLSPSQDQALQQWEPVKNSSNEDKVVYVPRKLANPADSSKIFRRRSFSSDSSADANQNNNLTCHDDSRWSTAMKISKDSETSSQEGTDLVTKLSSKCEEIDISFRDHLLCIKLCPRTSILRNSLNSNILKELVMVFRKLKVESSIRVVLITSSGPDFCNGIDFPFLISENMGQRLENAVALVGNVQEFILELANCDKILVGGLVGSVMGLGVAILPYLNFVYASDKSTFYLPYSTLGQGYEGGLSLYFSIRENLDNLLFTGGRRLTATQVKHFGLIQDVFLPDDFEKEVVLRACELASKFSSTMLLAKKIKSAGLRRDLPEVIKEESQQLRQVWISDDFQRRAKQLYANGDMLLS